MSHTHPRPCSLNEPAVSANDTSSRSQAEILTGSDAAASQAGATVGNDSGEQKLTQESQVILDARSKARSDYAQDIRALLVPEEKHHAPLTFIKKQLLGCASIGPNVTFHLRSDQGTSRPQPGRRKIDLPTGLRPKDEERGLILASNLTLDCLVDLSMEYSIDQAFWKHYIRKTRRNRSRWTRDGMEQHCDWVLRDASTQARVHPDFVHDSVGHDGIVSARFAMLELRTDLYLLVTSQADGPMPTPEKDTILGEFGGTSDYDATQVLWTTIIPLPYLDYLDWCDMLQERLLQPEFVMSLTESSSLKLYLSRNGFLRHLCYPVWRQALDDLRAEADDLEAEAVASPNRDLLREQSELRAVLIHHRAGIYQWHQVYWIEDSSYTPSPFALYETRALDEQMSSIHKRLKDGLQFAIAAINLDDAEQAKKQADLAAKQAARSMNLTILACIYLPLSLVTSIYGMQINEIKDQGLGWRDSVNTWLAVCALTFLVFVGVYGFRKSWESEQRIGVREYLKKQGRGFLSRRRRSRSEKEHGSMV